MSDNNIGGEEKFENCKHKSAEQKTVTIKRCSCQGGDYTDTGYECLSRKIFKIYASICQYCYMFERK